MLRVWRHRGGRRERILSPFYGWRGMFVVGNPCILHFFPIHGAAMCWELCWDVGLANSQGDVS